MDDKYLETLEYPKIIERLAGYTDFSAGRELALALRPSSDIAEVRRRQQETSEARAFLDLKSDASVGGARDVRPLVHQARLGRVLEPGELLDIRGTLTSGRVLRRAISRLAAEFPLLAQTAEGIQECPELVASIERVLNDRGEVLDSASPALARIRRDLATTHARLLERLNRIVNDPRNAAYLQEAIVTQREGRYVIPLKADFKGRIRGLVHDQSASGATLFIEPLATLELGNQWRKLQLDEEQEIRRILSELTAQVAEAGEAIIATVDALAALDLAFAKAKYSYQLKCVAPELVDLIEPTATRLHREREARRHHPGTIVDLVRARHPLLPPETVVPIDVWLGGDFDILVITGPNTGGKTVTLKTVGLLAAMAQAGLHIPASEGSALAVFDGLYADIGDEQSIEQSLSTFSSHLTNIIDILAKANERSLVLLDELGAGTDPVEGSALARAILSTLLDRRIPAMVATHYPQLKLYAHSTPRVQNASVEFDLETLSPTYELTIGLPGRSNALAIASRLGLSAEIIERARTWVSDSDQEADRLLDDIRTAREETARARREAAAALARIQEQERELARRLAEIESERQELLAEAREELQRIRAELRTLRAAMETQSITAEWIAQAERRLEQVKVASAPQPVSRVTSDLRVGDRVWVSHLNLEGEIVALDEEGAEIQVGNFRVRADPATLEFRSRPEVSQAKARSRTRLPTPSTLVPRQLHLRGARVEDALIELDKYLNDAYLAGMSEVSIVHGKGTGALRRAVRQALGDHPLVSNYRPGEQGEGGDGVTVVTLAVG